MPTALQSSSRAAETRKKLSMQQRARSVPYKRPFVVAVLASLIFYLSLIAFLTSVVYFAIAPVELNTGAAYTLAALLPMCGLFWTVAYFKRRNANCPLCKCTPFLDNMAHKHQKSFRIKPLNYGTTAVFNVVFTQCWRCMYCGSPFDILKSKRGNDYVACKDDQ